MRSARTSYKVAPEGLNYGCGVKRPTAPLYVEADAQQAVREAFQPLYGEPLTDHDVGEISDNLRRYYAILAEWDAEDKLRTGCAKAEP